MRCPLTGNPFINLTPLKDFIFQYFSLDSFISLVKSVKIEKFNRSKILRSSCNSFTERSFIFLCTEIPLINKSTFNRYLLIPGILEKAYKIFLCLGRGIPRNLKDN